MRLTVGNQCRYKHVNYIVLQKDTASGNVLLKSLQHANSFQNKLAWFESKRDTVWAMESEVHYSSKYCPQVFPIKQFTKTPSADGYNENLLLMLHGLGDSEVPFAKLAQQINLPQTGKYIDGYAFC